NTGSGGGGTSGPDLPLVTVGGSTPDITKRPKVGEDNATTGNVNLYNERLYTKSSLRILLSDTSADITNLPGIDNSKPPIKLDGDWATTPPFAGYAVGANTPPVARSLGGLGLIVKTSGSTSSGSTTISIQATTPVPGIFLKPAGLAAKDSANNRWQVTCTGAWTATTVTGCGFTI